MANKPKKGVNLKALVESLSDGRKYKLLRKIQDQSSLCDFLGVDYDESMCDQLEYHLKSALGEY